MSLKHDAPDFKRPSSQRWNIYRVAAAETLQVVSLQLFKWNKEIQTMNAFVFFDLSPAIRNIVLIHLRILGVSITQDDTMRHTVPAASSKIL